MKKIVLTVAGVAVFSFFAKAQISDTAKNQDAKSPSMTVTIDKSTHQGDSSKIYTLAEHVPEFPGGVNNFYKFLATNIHYPKDARAQNKQGRVIVVFIVEKDGSLSGIKVIRGVFPSIDAEAVRVLKLSPKWEPGILNGRAIRVQYTVPLNFSLQAPANKKPGN